MRLFFIIILALALSSCLATDKDLAEVNLNSVGRDSELSKLQVKNAELTKQITELLQELQPLRQFATKNAEAAFRQSVILDHEYEGAEEDYNNAKDGSSIIGFLGNFSGIIPGGDIIFALLTMLTGGAAVHQSRQKRKAISAGTDLAKADPMAAIEMMKNNPLFKGKS